MLSALVSIRDMLALEVGSFGGSGRKSGILFQTSGV